MKDKRSPLASDERQESQTEERTFTCSECGESFAKPLLANVSSQGVVQTYYACPRCLTEVHENDKAETNGAEPSAAGEKLKEEQQKPENQDCQHFLGYLRKRPREAAIPEACLTCRRIIECMAAG
jgi:transcription initiation factor IIE alpha subunit